MSDNFYDLLLTFKMKNENVAAANVELISIFKELKKNNGYFIFILQKMFKNSYKKFPISSMNNL